VNNNKITNLGYNNNSIKVIIIGYFLLFYLKFLIPSEQIIRVIIIKHFV